MLHTLDIAPELGMVLMCDFVGLKHPEITKRRHVIVVSPDIRNKSGTCIVVPISTCAPKYQWEVCVDLSYQDYEFLKTTKTSFAVCHMLTHVRLQRLDRVISNRMPSTPKLLPIDLDRVLGAIGTVIARRV